ncbi:class I SAM-dependent methyltransferase [Gryllotalpicola daejeonensis]
MPADVGGEWNRDAAYHPWIQRIAAEHAGDVLDVGCGDGLLALRLAAVSRSVVGIDRDAAAIAEAHKRLRMVANTDVAVSEFGTEWGLTPDSYDVITMVSVLHELPLLPTLERVVELLKPGGTLIVVGEAEPTTLIDRALELISVPYAWALQTFYTWRGMYRPEFVSEQSVAPTYSYADVMDAAAELLPGAELHRGLLRRYRLRWSKPVEVAAGEVDLAAMTAATSGRATAAGHPSSTRTTPLCSTATTSTSSHTSSTRRARSRRSSPAPTRAAAPDPAASSLD